MRPSSAPKGWGPALRSVSRIFCTLPSAANCANLLMRVTTNATVEVRHLGTLHRVLGETFAARGAATFGAQRGGGARHSRDRLPRTVRLARCRGTLSVHAPARHDERSGGAQRVDDRQRFFEPRSCRGRPGFADDGADRCAPVSSSARTSRARAFGKRGERCVTACRSRGRTGGTSSAFKRPPARCCSTA